jgi:hypothetical protein
MARIPLTSTQGRGGTEYPVQEIKALYAGVLDVWMSSKQQIFGWRDLGAAPST